MEMRVLTHDQAERIVKVAVIRLASYIRENGLKGVTTGISGGINSAVISVIGMRAIKMLQTDGYECGFYYPFLDVESDPYDLMRARAHANAFGYKLHEVDLTPTYRRLRATYEDAFPWESTLVARANAKCRLRMVTLYEIAGNNGYIYLDTDDYPEMQMGFWTLKGDEGDLKLLQLITKTEYYDLGVYLGVPEVILLSEPGDGLGVTPGSKASDQLGLPYDMIEYILSVMIGSGWQTEMRPEPDGTMVQFSNKYFQAMIGHIVKMLEVDEEKVLHVLRQNLKTTFKREGVQLLLDSRGELGLPEVGSIEFTNLIYKAIRARLKAEAE